MKKPDLIKVKLAIFMWIAIALFRGHPAVFTDASSIIEVGRFSNGKASDVLPLYWQIFDFKEIKRHTTYRLLEEKGVVVVKAEANASASRLIQKIRINPKEYPIVQWRWKAVNVLKKGNVYRKEEDDYPARIYISFEVG